MTKIDFKRELDCYKAKPGTFQILEVPNLQYLMIDGHGDPNTSAAWADAISTIYPTAYALKFASKNHLNRDYVVMPLEATWWAEDMAAFTSSRDKSQWSWTAMNMVPGWITAEMFEAAVQQSAAKKPGLDFSALRLQTLDEGLSVQILHVGSYDDEGPVLRHMHEEFIPEHELEWTGRHHEIYLSDARKGDAAKLRTILRQPVQRLND